MGAMTIRHAVLGDLDAAVGLETVCFPAAEAASRASLARRLSVFPDRFWLLFDGDRLAAMVDGLCTSHPDLEDVMFDDAGMHEPEGAWQMIFGVETLPSRQGRGYASRLLRQAVDQCRAEGRKGLVLTAKDRLVPFYERLGFKDEGLSASEHGGVPWHQMRLTF